MKSSITKSIIFGIIFACVYLFAFTGKVEANSPAVTGSILTSVTNAPIPNVWVKWTDGWGNIRYTQADGSGNFNFPSWQNSYGWDSQAQMDTRQIMTQTKININLDGTNCAALSNFDFLVAVGQGSCAYQAYHPSTDWGSGFGCDQEPNIFTAIKPYNFYGSFEVITLPDVLRPGVNNSLATMDIGPIYFTSGPPPTPTPTGSPALGALHIAANTTDGAIASSTYGKSGLRLDDPNLPANSGSNYYNSLIITQQTTIATPINVKLVGVAFVESGTTSPVNNSNLPTLMASADRNNGFIMVYAFCGGVSTCSVDGYNFLRGLYYAYFAGAWSSRGYNPNNSDPIIIPNTLKINMQSAPNLSTIFPTFYVTLYKPLGSRTWGTYGYMASTNNMETSTALTPIP